MIFILLLILTTTAIAGAAAFFSVYGLAQMFSGAFLAVVFMGSSLEAGKLVAASFVYRYWNKIGIFLKGYLMFAIFILMVITSTGIFGFLSQGYLSDSMPLKEVEVNIESLKAERDTLTKRKVEIDTQIASLPTNVVRGRQKLIKEFSAESKKTNIRLNELVTEIRDMEQKVLITKLHVGPITYIATAMGKNIDDATKYIILLLIIAFDPLAVALTIGTNKAILLYKEEKEERRLKIKEEQRQEREESYFIEKRARDDAEEQHKLHQAEQLTQLHEAHMHEEEMIRLKNAEIVAQSAQSQPNVESDNIEVISVPGSQEETNPVINDLPVPIVSGDITTSTPEYIPSIIEVTSIKDDQVEDISTVEEVPNQIVDDEVEVVQLEQNLDDIIAPTITDEITITSINPEPMVVVDQPIPSTIEKTATLAELRSVYEEMKNKEVLSVDEQHEKILIENILIKKGLL